MKASFLSYLPVSENFAITAAHCFNNQRDTSLIYLLVGDHDISKGDDTPYASLYATQKVIRHEDYVAESDDQNNDIALLRTSEAMRWKRTVGPACLPYIYDGYETYFDGYSLVGE
jgi:secreted trypsin-like serine protease